MPGGYFFLDPRLHELSYRSVPNLLQITIEIRFHHVYGIYVATILVQFYT